jgi:hypothetical protein
MRRISTAKLLACFLMFCSSAVLSSCERRQQTATAVPADTPELAAAWANITDQMRTYQVLQTLSGTERVQAANKVVFGYTQLKRDVQYFMSHSVQNDPRRSRVIGLQVAMDNAERKTGSAP